MGEGDVPPDIQSGDGGPNLRPHCHHATHDGQGRMSDSDRRHGR